MYSKKVETGGFPSQMKKDVNYGMDGYNLSHKVSAHQVNMQYEMTSQFPQHVQSTTYFDDLRQATNTQYLSKSQKNKFNLSLDYLENHSTYTGPMSPKSQQNNYLVHNVFANKNIDNLRMKDSHENQSIQQFPHFEINNGNLSPRSNNGLSFVNTFHSAMVSQMDKTQKMETEAYTEMPKRISTSSKSFNTSDQMDYARQCRANKW